jgi:helix-turn-helix protein
MMRKFKVLLPIAVFLSYTLFSAEISNINVSFKEDDMLLSFRADEVFVRDVESRIKSGLEVVFRYEICIKKPRRFLGDPVLFRKILTTHVQYDPFKNQYKLLKKIDDKVIEAKMTDSEKEMRLWMTSFSNMRFLLLSVLKKGSKYYIAIRGDFLSSSFFFLIPTGVKADWKKKDFVFEG